MKIVFHFDGSAALRARLAAMGVELCPESDEQAFARLLPEVEVLWHVLKPVTAVVIARAPKLRLVHKIGSGVNTIDVEACKARGIAVCNLPGTNSRAVAEMALLLMLACLRRIRELDAAVRKPGGWFEAWNLQDNFGELGGSEPYERTANPGQLIANTKIVTHNARGAVRAVRLHVMEF